MVKNIVVTF